MNNRRLNNIMNNLFDLLILSVKIGVSWLMDKWIEVKSVYFVGKETIEEVNTVVELDGIWNGGTTISKSNKDLNNTITCVIKIMLKRRSSDECFYIKKLLFKILVFR